MYCANKSKKSKLFSIPESLLTNMVMNSTVGEGGGAEVEQSYFYLYR